MERRSATLNGSEGLVRARFAIDPDGNETVGTPRVRLSFSPNRGSMAEKSRRRLMLEQSLADDPTDSFLRYGLAIQCLREGDVEEGRERLLALIADHPEDQVAAYQQLAQSYADSGERHGRRGHVANGHHKGKGRRRLARGGRDAANA